jgi:hypothetical protein
VSIHIEKAYRRLQRVVVSKTLETDGKVRGIETLRLLLEFMQIFMKISHRDSVWTVLTGSATEQTSSIVIYDVKEIETWILRLLSAPVPIPNSTRVEVNVY